MRVRLTRMGQVVYVPARCLSMAVYARCSCRLQAFFLNGPRGGVMSAQLGARRVEEEVLVDSGEFVLGTYAFRRRRVTSTPSRIRTVLFSRSRSRCCCRLQGCLVMKDGGDLHLMS